MRIKSIILMVMVFSAGLVYGQRRRKGKDYISELRPQYNVEMKTDDLVERTGEEPETKFTQTINDSLDYYVDSMKVVYGRGGVGKPASSVLAFNGTDKDKALKIRRKVLKQFPNARVTNEYVAPNWKVKVGPFLNRLDAVRIKETLIRSGVKNVLIVPDTILYRNGKIARN